MRVRRAPVPWIFEDVVKSQLSGAERVMDIGTGGGERLIKLVDSYGTAVGIDNDPRMIATATENLPTALKGKIEFRVASAESTGLPGSSVDAVLNRHSVVDVPEITRVLRRPGKLIWQTIGDRNLASVIGALGGQEMDDDQRPDAIRQRLIQRGMSVTRFDEYDVTYEFLDLESLVFQVKATSHYLSEFSGFDSISEALLKVVDNTRSPEGAFVSNEHRSLLVAGFK